MKRLRRHFINPLTVVHKTGFAYLLNLLRKFSTHSVFNSGLLMLYRDSSPVRLVAFAPPWIAVPQISTSTSGYRAVLYERRFTLSWTRSKVSIDSGPVHTLMKTLKSKYVINNSAWTGMGYIQSVYLLQFCSMVKSTASSMCKNAFISDVVANVRNSTWWGGADALNRRPRGKWSPCYGRMVPYSWIVLRRE